MSHLFTSHRLTSFVSLRGFTRQNTQWALGLALMACLVQSPSASAQTVQPIRSRYHRAAEEYRASMMRDENGYIPPNALMNALQQKKQLRFDPAAWPGTPAAAADLPTPDRTAGIEPSAWVWLGPGNIGGRIRSVLVHPINPSIMWIGSVCGGIWKTTNAGANWAPMNDFMANLAIGSMVMDPTDPNIIYAGTGEGFSNADSLRGAGIFKTTDGGTVWTQLSSTANSSFFFVNRLAICPTNHLILLAATSTGIWRSTDGGTSWSQRYNSAAMLDVNFHPTDGLAIAGGQTSGRALYSTTAGLSWLAATGLPAAGRVEVAYAPSSPTTVYASQENSSGQIYISADGGQTYTLRNTGNSYLGGQGWYDNALWVDPTNPNILIVGGIDLWRSTDGGTTLTKISQWFSAPSSAHADHHVIVQHPGFEGVTNKTVYFGNDGGLYRAVNAYTVSLTSGWQELNNNLGVTEYYGAAGNVASGTIVGGTQDNGTLRYTPAGGTEGATAMFGGDGGYCASDPTDPNYFYGEYVYLQIHRSANGGTSSSYIFSGIGDAGIPNIDPDEEPEPKDPEASANFISPFILDPNNANTMLAGGSNLWRSLNVKAGTPTWANIKPGANASFISAIAVAQGNSDIIWVGHNNGDVYSTGNGTAVNPTWTRKDLGAPNLPNRKVLRLTIDPFNPNVVYAAFAGFNSGNLYRTTDGGTTWAIVGPSLPSAPFHSLVVAPFNTNYLYLATEVGVFASADWGATWSTGNEGAANVCVEELFWMDRTLVAATHGRGIFKVLVTTAPSIALVSAAITSESCSNGIVENGELLTMNFTLTNLVSNPTANLLGTLLATNGVASPSAPQNYGVVNLGSPAVTRSFSFTVAGQCGSTVVATLKLTDGTNDVGTVSASFQVGLPRVLTTESFDSVTPPNLPAGWTTAVSGAGAAWVTVNSPSDTAPNSVFTADVDNSGESSLTSPLFAVTSTNAQLRFRHSYDTEVPFDGGVLEISIAGGAYTDILTAGGSFVTNGYNQAIFVGSGNPLEGRQAWSGSSGGFVTTIATLPAAAAGQSIRLRWRFGSDASVFITGWYVDSVQLNDGFDCRSPAAPPTLINPAYSGATFHVSVPTVCGWSYVLEYKDDINVPGWTGLAPVAGDGTTKTLTDPGASGPQRFYRVRLQ